MLLFAVEPENSVWRPETVFLVRVILWVGVSATVGTTALFVAMCLEISLPKELMIAGMVGLVLPGVLLVLSRMSQWLGRRFKWRFTWSEERLRRHESDLHRLFPDYADSPDSTNERPEVAVTHRARYGWGFCLIFLLHSWLWAGLSFLALRAEEIYASPILAREWWVAAFIAFGSTAILTWIMFQRPRLAVSDLGLVLWLGLGNKRVAWDDIVLVTRSSVSEAFVFILSEAAFANLRGANWLLSYLWRGVTGNRVIAYEFLLTRPDAQQVRLALEHQCKAHDVSFVCE